MVMQSRRYVHTRHLTKVAHPCQSLQANNDNSIKQKVTAHPIPANKSASTLRVKMPVQMVKILPSRSMKTLVGIPRTS